MTGRAPRLACPDCGQPLWETKTAQGYALLCLGPAALTPERIALRRADLEQHGTPTTAAAHERRLRAAAASATGCGRIVEKPELRRILTP